MLPALIFALVGGAEPSLYTNVHPPARFQRDTSFVLEVRDQAGINRICDPLFGRPPAGMKTDACHTGRKVVAPNPCSYPQTETYARLLCHEMAHANGWPPTHGGFEPSEIAGRLGASSATGASASAAGPTPRGGSGQR